MIHSSFILRGITILFTIPGYCVASPLYSSQIFNRATPNTAVKVLADLSKRQPRFSDLCSEENIEALQGSISDLKLLTTAAAKMLLKPGASQSEPVQAYLGDVTDNDLANIVRLRYTNAQNFFPTGKLQTESAQTDSDVLYFICPTGLQYLESSECRIEESNGSWSENSFAVADNVLEGSESNTIALCPRFFAGISLQQQVAQYQQSKATGPLDSFDTPTTPGVTLLHETQHSLTVMQSTNLCDIAEDVTNGVSPAQCVALSAEAKLQNAENFALLAFVAYADPTRFGEPTQSETSDSEGPDSEGAS